MRYSQRVQKAELVGNSKGGRQKWVRFGNRETPYKLAARLCFATEATAAARSQKVTSGGGGALHSKRHLHRRKRRLARQQPPNQKRPPRSPLSAPHHRGTPPGPPKTPATRKVCGSPPSSANSKDHTQPLEVSSKDSYVTMGVQHVKGCCVLHVSMLWLWKGCSIFKVQRSEKSLKKFFEEVLLVFERLLQR